jgi:hypothetical protein
MSLFTTYIEYLERVCGSSKRWKFVYSVNLWVYQHVKQFCLQLLSVFRRTDRNCPVKLFFYRRTNNFGDQLNLDVMRYFGMDFAPAEFGDANTVCIGSILDNALRTDSRTLSYRKPLHVLGAGFIIGQECEKEKFCRPVQIHALRGKLSLARCEAMSCCALPDVVLGDPGLLVRRIFPHLPREKKYDVGIICHLHDVNSPHAANIRIGGKSLKMIDVLCPTEQFLREMMECRFILSSSLHGVICADSLGIPNKAVVLSGNVEGNGYKFEDYYSVFDGVTYDPVDLRKTVISADDLEIFEKNYKNMESQIEKICDSLEQCFRKYKENAKRPSPAGRIVEKQAF